MGSTKSFKFYSGIILTLGFFMFLFQTALVMDILNVILPVIEAQKGWTAGAINGAVSIGPFFGALLGIALSSLILKFGPKNTTIGSVVLMSAAAIGMGVANNIVTFAACMAAVQIISGVLLIAIPALMANWYHLKRGTVLGIITIGAPCSTAFFTPLASYMIHTVGYTTTILSTAIAFLVIGVVLTMFVPEKPENVGLFQDGAKQPYPKATLPDQVSRWTILTIFSKKETWILVISFGAVYFMMTGIMSNMIPRLLGQGIPLPTALTMLSVGAILGIPMSYAWGRIDDKISTPKTSAIFLLFYVIASVSLIFVGPDKLYLAVIATFCIAATTGGMPNLIPSSIIWVFGRDEYVNVHRWLGGIYNVCRSGAFVLMAWALTQPQSYAVAYYIFIPIAVISSLLLLGLRKSYDPSNPINLKNSTEVESGEKID